MTTDSKISSDTDDRGLLRFAAAEEPRFFALPVVGLVPVLAESLVDAELLHPQPAAGDRLGAVGIDVLDVVGLALNVEDDVFGRGSPRSDAEPNARGDTSRGTSLSWTGGDP